MHDGVNRIGMQGFLKGFCIAQISDDKRIVPDRLSMSFLEVVVDNWFKAMPFQLLNDMASNVSSPSGDKYGRNVRGLSLADY